MELKTWAVSSQNPEQVSHTVRGIVLTCAPLIILVAQYLNVPFTESQVGNIAVGAGVAAGAVWTLYGLGMKVLMFFAKK